MTYSINPKIPYNNQVSMGIGGPQAPLPIQNIDTEKIKQGVNNNPISKNVEKEDQHIAAILTLPAWLGISKGMEAFNKRLKGNYEDSLVGKMERFGNKIGESKLFTSKFMQKTNGAYSNFKNFLSNKVVNNSAVLRAFFRTPSMPKNSMVLTQMGGTLNEVANDAVQMFGYFTEDGKNLEKIKQLGFVDAAGNADVIKYNKVIKESRNHIDDLISACNKMPNDEKVRVGKLFKWKAPKILSRDVYFSEVSNKLTALKGLKNPREATMLGKIIPKHSLRVMEGLTNGLAGGKLAIAMQAYFVADAIRLAIKAKKGEKANTFGENMVYNLGWYMTMPLGIRLMHKFGGLKYIGMSPHRLKEYRKALEEFNAKADAGGFANRKEYYDASQKLKKMLSGKVDPERLKAIEAAGHKIKGLQSAKWYHKPFKWIGNILTYSLESKRAFVKADAGKFTKEFKNLGYWMKKGVGTPLRIGVFFLAISPFLAKIVVKGYHGIFGRPSKSVLDEEPTTPPAEAAAQANVATPMVNPAQAVAPAGSTNLINRYNSKPQQPQSVPSTVQAPIAQASVPVKSVETAPIEPKRTYSYIPNPVGVKLSAEAQAKLAGMDAKTNQSMNRADKAEQEALKFLH